jgi:hypothetical protein
MPKDKTIPIDALKKKTEIPPTPRMPEIPKSSKPDDGPTFSEAQIGQMLQKERDMTTRETQCTQEIRDAINSTCSKYGCVPDINMVATERGNRFFIKAIAKERLQRQAKDPDAE